MIKKSHFIIYVESQAVSTRFYSKLLDREPILNVPGMSEFMLTENSILGIMPSSGIKKLLQDKVEVIQSSEGFIKSELYIVVDDIACYLKRAITLKAKVLSELGERDWGHKVAYLLDPDNYVIAITEML